MVIILEAVTTLMFRTSISFLSIIFFAILISLNGCIKDDENDGRALYPVEGNPVVTTGDAIDVTQSTATLSGRVVSGEGINLRGICWNTFSLPTVNNSNSVSGSGLGAFTVSAQNLALGTKYYVRAYAVSNAGTFYGQQITFTTSSVLTEGINYEGGIIFYLDTSGLHGLVCAATDQGTMIGWGCPGAQIPGANSSNIGQGQKNTNDINQGCSDTTKAAYICSNLLLNGYSDWFLPSKNELLLMYTNLKENNIGNFTNSTYWSSTEMNSDFAWQVIFNNGISQGGSKSTKTSVRAVRAF